MSTEIFKIEEEMTEKIKPKVANKVVQEIPVAMVTAIPREDSSCVAIAIAIGISWTMAMTMAIPREGSSCVAKCQWQQQWQQNWN